MLDVIKIAGVTPGLSVLEPAAGDGAIAEPLRDIGTSVTTNDLVCHNGYITDHSVDFLTGVIPGNFDKVIMNPPFSLSQQFIDKSLNYAPEVWVLLRGLYLEGVTRNQLLRNHLEEYHIYTRRVEFVSGKNAMCFAWFKFMRTKTKPDPTIHWI